MKIKKINLNRGKSDICFLNHLRRLKLIENRENHYKSITKKSNDHSIKLYKIQSEVNFNNLILKQKSPKLLNKSYDFICQFNAIRKFEIDRLKFHTKLLNNLINEIRNPISKLKISNSEKNFQLKNTKLKQKYHSLPYMRFANPYK